jgi:adenylosuccinate synthase
MNIKYVDVCCGLAWGDEGKGKITSYLAKSKNYDFVCRWAGGNNAGHTIYINNKKYKTHLIPSGVFYGVKSIIGPDCVINIKSFFKEIDYLKQNGFDTSLIKISPKTHIITEQHLTEETSSNHLKSLGTTSSGIAPAYRDKYARIGKRVCDFSDIFKDYIWDEKLYGCILCEGAQGFWLDINYGKYPFITSSCTLPYGCCSLGFPPQLIRHIYGATKIYDTRSGIDTDFPESLLEDFELKKIGDVGEEYGTTTGRKRKVNWLNLDKLIMAINYSGTTHLIISKVDILKEVNIFKMFYEKNLIDFKTINEMYTKINEILVKKCGFLQTIQFSDNKETI